MNKIHLIIIGGFLGSGKTTSITSIAKHFLKQGKKIGIVTNDQGSDLVDTNFLRSNGLSVLEVTGGCFCCNFDQFVEKINSLAEKNYPNIILAEPVGSCTDLIATIFKPIASKYMNKLELKPLSIVVDPRRVRIIMREEETLFHSEVNYIFKKQLEEADLIVLNKTDLLTPIEKKEMEHYLISRFNSPVISVSSKNGTNLENWIYNLYQMEESKCKTLNIDYALYAKGEERLGWLNLCCTLRSEGKFNVNSVMIHILYRAKEILKERKMEIAHLKVYGVSKEDWAKISITSIMDIPTFDKSSEKEDKEWNLIINARVDCDPDVLRQTMEKSLNKATEERNITVSDINIQCFKPGKPEPKYRIR